jgi:V/A-type H+-transporting ATPase subunit C
LKSYKDAKLYGYSNARVKAMKSKLVGRSVLNEILKTESIPTILARLLQTDYKEYIEEYGDISQRAELVDVALNKSLVVNVEKLIRIAPKRDISIMERIVGVWDIYNIKLILYAKLMNKDFKYLSRYLIETKSFDEPFVKEALAEQDFYATASRLMKVGSYRDEIKAAVEAYRKTSNITEVNAAIDKRFFEGLGDAIETIKKRSPKAAQLIRFDIEMRNILTLLRAKKSNLKSSDVAGLIIGNGITQPAQLIKIYEGSSDLKELAANVKSFDLRKAMEAYQAEKSKQMLLFEISMRGSMFKKAISVLHSAVLNFGVLVSYFYLKEIEVFTLRVYIVGKMHGLTNEEITGMTEWQM